MIAGMALSPLQTFASDHDDGEMELKGRNLNLTDLYAFQEANQTGMAGDASNLILVMNTNPRSLPGQEYFFSTQARYEFHISRVHDKKKTPTGSDDVTIRMEFSSPDGAGRQRMSMVMIDRNEREINGASRAVNAKAIYTTPISASKAEKLAVSDVMIDGSKVSVFAGLREDPFFFDVERFFDVRADLAAGKPFKGFLPADQANDFTKNYNVNAIVLRIPMELLQTAAKEKTFDVWETISIRTPRNTYRQIERLGRPAINEGLVLTNKSLNLFNAITPSQDLKGGSYLNEAAAVLGILAKIGGQPSTHVGNVVKGFLPDVLRIDMSAVIPVGSPGYVGDFVINDQGAPMLTGGRKIEDDVIDETLTYLVFGADGLLGSDPNKKVSDGVSYAGAPGNRRQGHKNLHGQSEGKYLSPATFPFLATPN